MLEEHLNVRGVSDAYFNGKYHPMNWQVEINSEVFGCSKQYKVSAWCLLNGTRIDVGSTSDSYRSLKIARKRAENLARLLGERYYEDKWQCFLADGSLTEPEGCWRKHSVKDVSVTERQKTDKME